MIGFIPAKEREYTTHAKNMADGRKDRGHVWNLSVVLPRGNGIINVWVLNVKPGSEYRFFKTYDEAEVGKVLLT